MKIRELIEKELWDKAYFSPGRLQPKRLLYAVEFRGSKLQMMIDGFTKRALWPAAEAGPAATFFDVLRPLVVRYGAAVAYIQNPDDAFSEILFVNDDLKPEFCSVVQLAVFDWHPVEEGGVAYLCIAFNGQNAMIVIKHQYGIEISCYGNPAIADEIAANLKL